MNHLKLSLLSVGVTFCVGCGSDYKAAPIPTAQPVLPASQPASQARPQPGIASRRSPVELSVGVALPQSMPEGTMMGFSVDYRFAEGAKPDPAAKYVWVLQRGRGEPMRVPARLEPQGTLQAFVRWRPEDGPFRSHLEDEKGARVSEPIVMK